MKSLVALSAVCALCQAVALPLSDHVLHEKRNALSFWSKRDRVSSDMVLPMRIGLKQNNFDIGHDLLMDLTKHNSPNYGQWLSAEAVAELFAPSDMAVQDIKNWLTASGIASHRISQSVNRGWLQFDATAAEAEKLLGTEFFIFEHERTNDENIATDEYFVPGNVAQHIDYITPGVKLIPNASGARKNGAGLAKRGFGSKPGQPTIRKPLPAGFNATSPYSEENPLAKCDQAITPACVRALYNIPLGTKKANGNQLGIYESGDAYSQASLDIFWKHYFPTIPQGTGPEVRSVDGGVAPVSPSDAGGESCLDLDLAYPIIWPQTAVIYQTDDTPYVEEFDKAGLFNNFLDAIDGSYCSYSYDGETGNDPQYDFSYPDSQKGGYKGKLQCGVYKPTNVISISYGVNEADYSPAYQQRQCQEWLKLGLQGVSVILASGDSGVGGRPGQNGHSNGCLEDNGKVYNPDYPGTCPYMTVVGSTYLPTGHKVGVDPEIATESFSSGGGFSNVYPVPDYQQSAVSNYFQTAPARVKQHKYYSVFTKNQTIGENGGIYNRDGRGYPDVSAVGDNIVSTDGMDTGLVGGTSASAPVWASIITRINEERIAAGKKTVGFINPTLYAHPEVFNDIVSGNNTACESVGFIASKGWDPVTGLGTPKYDALLKLFMSLN